MCNKTIRNYAQTIGEIAFLLFFVLIPTIIYANVGILLFRRWIIGD